MSDNLVETLDKNLIITSLEIPENLQENTKLANLQDTLEETTNLSNISGTTVQEDNKDIDVNQLEEEDEDEDITMVSFGPKGAWHVKWAGGTSSWEFLEPSLHSKLKSRNKNLPELVSLSMSNDNHWVAIFKDGSFATSGFLMTSKMQEAFFDDYEPVKFIYAPAGGWLLLRIDGSLAWERLPTGLDQLLRRRAPGDSSIEQITISGFGGWFVRFKDGECEWEGIPKQLEKILIANIRHAHPNILVSLSPVDGLSYFVCIGETAEWISDSTNLRVALEYMHSKDTSLPESVSWEA